MMEWVGYGGLLALALCWIPQTVETIRRGRCDINLPFLVLSGSGSFLLMVYAMGRGDLVFILLNALTTLGALLNLYYRLMPRTSHAPTGPGNA